MVHHSKRTDFILEDLFLDCSLPSDGRSFLDSRDTIGGKLAHAMKSLIDGAQDKLAAVTGAQAGPSQDPVEAAAAGRYKPQTLIRNIAHTVEVFASAIPELGIHDHQIQAAAHVFRECLSVCKSFPTIVINPEDDAAKQARHMDFHAFVSKILPRVRQLAPGTTMMTPIGWLCSSGRRNDEFVHGNVLLLILHRRIDKPDEFTVSVCNSTRDQGLSYHPPKADGNGDLRLVPLTLKAVKRERIINGAFWVMLMKSIVYPSPSNGAKWIYSSVLPSLSGIPIDAQLTVFPELASQGMWLPPAEGGDKSGAICATYALYAILQLSGKSAFEAQWLSQVLLRKTILEQVADIRSVPSATRGLMLRSLAWHACRLKQAFPDRLDAGPIEDFIDSVSQAEDPHRVVWMCPKLPAGPSGLRFSISDCHYWLFDRIASMEEVESQAGKPKPPKVLLPVPLASIRDSVNTLTDLRELWADVVHCCALLQNQQTQIPHAQALVFGLVVHSITRVTPCVTSVWWDNLPMTEDTREFLLRQLHLIIGHFAASAFSLGGRAIDGSRIVCSSALMAFCDKLCRTISIDRPSVFAKHYGGTASGPVGVFGLGPGVLADETACSLLLSPDLVTTRATILEYFESLNVAGDHELFQFDDRVDFGQAEFQLVEQLCLAMGMYTVIPESPYLISGEKKDLLTYFPELGWLRDVAFLSKILMNPDGEKLPPIKSGGYKMSDAELFFKFEKQGKVLVKGFGMKQLDLCGGYKNSRAPGVVDKFKGLFFWKRGTGRVYPSLADPSNLCNGDVIASEDDVLHCKNLPKFTSLGRASVERLVTLLTAPYLRIPLLVAFFRDREKVAALAEPKIQAVMDAALFEPGRWKSVRYDTGKSGKPLSPADIRIPGEPSVLHSPWGLMYNELIYAPKNTIEGLIDLLDAAIERDSGRFGSPSSKVIMYACRLTCRVGRFIEHLLANQERIMAGGALSTGLPLNVRIALETGLRTIRDKLAGQAWSILTKWSDRALNENRIDDACAIQAHISLVAVCKSDHMDWETVTALLGSQAYLSMNHRWNSVKKNSDSDETGGAETGLGGVYEFELLDVFAATRRAMADIIASDARRASDVMDSVVKLLTQSALVSGKESQLQKKVSDRNWITTDHLPGVYVPDTEAPNSTWLVPLAKEGYAAWLLRTTRPLALTVNINLGQFSLTDQQLSLVPDWALEYIYYTDLFGKDSLQVAEVKSTTNREWLRIVGHSHDLQRWTNKCERAPPDLGGRGIPAGHWAGELLFSTVQSLTPRQVLPQALKIADELEDRFCLLTGTLHTADGVTHRDILVGKNPSIVSIFDVVEYGRRWYRRLVWSSDESLSLGDCFPLRGREVSEDYELVPKTPVTGTFGATRVVLMTSDLDQLVDPPGVEESLVITRNVQKEVGEQTLIPSAYLRGILPDVLLLRYRFWQFQDGSLEGEWISTEAERTGQSIRVEFANKLGDSVSRLKKSTVIVTRERTDRLIGNQILVNLAALGDNHSLAQICRRMDNLSHAIVWGNQDSMEVEEIEFPRLRLSFKRRRDRLFCEQHEGYWIMDSDTTSMSPSFEKILQSLIGASVVLCASNGTRAIVVASHIKPVKASGSAGAQCVFSRNPLAPLGHFFYPAHLSEQFVTTQSLMSAVHLLRTRWMARQYQEAVDMIPCVFGDTVDMEALSVLKDQEELSSDIHPDAYGLRLRLVLAILPFLQDPTTQVPWDVAETMTAYLLRVRYASAAVRLSLQDERFILEDVVTDTMKRPVLANRLLWLRGVANGMPSVPCSLTLSSGDGWCSDTSVPSNEASLRIVWPKLRSYTRPENDLNGPSAVQFIVESDGIHPMLLVEVACKWFSLRVDDEDDCVSTCMCLNRLSSSSYDSITHTMHTLFSNPGLLVQVQPIPKKSALDILGNANYNWLKALCGIAKQSSPPPPMDLGKQLPEPWVPEDSVVCPTSDWEAAPFVSDCDQEIRTFRGDMTFGNRPLEKLCDQLITVSIGSGTKPHVDQIMELLTVLGNHQNANTDLGRAWIIRVKADVQIYMDQLDGEEQYKPQSGLSVFRPVLQAQLDEDWSEMRRLMDHAVTVSNSGGLRIAQQAGIDVEVSFSTLIRMLMSERGDHVLSTLHRVRKAKMNSTALSSTQTEEVMNTVAEAMFRAVRVGQLLRTLALLPKDQSGEISEAQQNKLLRELAGRRYFCTTKSSNEFVFDPRLLSAEFLFGVMFRESQVLLLNKFIERSARNEPIVHQMIMGAGKTTVIAPLLGMMLATPKRLVVSCVPAALLEFSREVMRERYSSPVLATPVVTFQFARQDRADEFVLRKLRTARARRAVVVATPQTLKSVMLKLAELRYILIADDAVKQSAVIAATRSNKILRKLVGAGKRMGLVKRGGPKKMKEHERQDIEKQIEICISLLRLFKEGHVMMDEVDMLLHPLRSELRWPLGNKAALDLTEPFGHKVNDEESIGMRWRIAWHLVSAIMEDSANLPFQEISEARSCIEGLKVSIKAGVDSHAISTTPHLVLLNRQCYQQTMLPHLTRWAIVFVRSKSVALQVPDSALMAFLENHGSEEITRVLPDREVKVLVLFRQWLHVLLPFIFSRKHRVEFGLLPKDWIVPGTPKSRRLLAVPFVGKDRPSPTSEFSHPDVLIGLSLIAYRLNGLRADDLKELILSVREDMEEEAGKPYYARKACQRYVRWIIEIGGRVRGFSWAGVSLTDIKERDNTGWREFQFEEVLMNSVWPLELIDVRDKEQMGKLFQILKHSMTATVHFLFNCAFPEALDHTPSVLVASGQELGGYGLFGQRMGFSGTPNDLLPKPMGTCVYDAGCDGRIACTLTSVSVVIGMDVLEPEWTPRSLLNRVVHVAGQGRAHALIDCGALVTNLTNLEVANILLDTLPVSKFDAVVFVSDNEDERLVLERQTRKIIPFAQAGFARNRCFTFYDQIHTTGIDIEQPLGCTAILTLGKDSTFRDYAQAAYRMRGLGDVGQQKLSLLVSPQVNYMISTAVMNIQSVGCQVLGWTILNSLAAEVGQYMLLCQQNVENLWRSSAWDQLALGNAQAAPECLDVLKELVDYVVDTDVANRETRYGIMQKKVKNYAKWLDQTRKETATNILLDLERIGRSSDVAKDTAKAIGKIELDAEQINENEITVEEEQEVTVQTQLIEELTVMAETDEAVQEKNFSREGESVNAWKLNALLDPHIPTDSSGSSPFYPLKSFSVYSGILKATIPAIEFPSCMLLSNNYYRPQWRISSVKRLKNVIVVLEYVPDQTNGAKTSTNGGILSSFSSNSSSTVKPAQVAPNWLSDPLALLDEALQVLDLDAAHSLTGENIEDALDCLFLDRGPASPLNPSKILKGESEIPVADFKAIVTAWYLNKRMSEINEVEDKKMASIDLLGTDIPTTTVSNYQDVSRTVIAENAPNRYFAIVSLAEAEYLRSAMHRLMGSVDCPPFALRVPGLLARPLDTSVTMASGRIVSNPILPLMADQVARFVDNDPSGFTSAQLTLLMKTLAGVPYTARREWYLRNMQCRVRPTKPWQQLSVARLFVSPQEQAEMQLEAALDRLQTSLVTRSIDPRSLFVSWDLSRKARVSAIDAVSGIQALQIAGLSSVDINRVVRKAEVHEGVVSLELWLRLFPESMVNGSSADVYDTGFKVLSADQGLLTELGGITDAHRTLFQMLKETDTNARYKVKLMTHDSVKKIWSSTGLNCPHYAVWEPTQLASGGGLLHARSHSVRERVCLGHLVTFGSDRSLTQCTVIEIRDMFAGYPKKQMGETLEDFIEKIFPSPSSYRLVWAEKTNINKSLYVWRPVPRNEAFQAVGVVCTTDAKEPSLNEVRTIPRQWLARELVDIKDRSLRDLTWKDGGRRIWQQELLSVMDADKDANSDVFPMWQILSDRFFLATAAQPANTEREKGPVTKTGMSIPKEPISLLDSSPPLSGQSGQASIGFSLLDSTPKNGAATSVRPGSNSPQSLI